MGKPTNTSNLDPMMLFMGAMLNPHGHIDQMEEDGQSELVHSESLPSRINFPREGEEELLVKWGFEFGAPFEDDPIFRPAKLPPGWSKQPSSHAMWSYVVDEQGRRRISIFYKAAFYDRSAQMSVESRYRTDYVDPPDGYDFHKQLVDSKTGAILFEQQGNYADRPSDEIEAFAKANLPSDWRHPRHWDEP